MIQDGRLIEIKTIRNKNKIITVTEPTSSMWVLAVYSGDVIECVKCYFFFDEDTKAMLKHVLNKDKKRARETIWRDEELIL